jgi:hypothetical protein|tara:strand:+ start:247 stop:453 length:207 start_codon:yes stop_codon:yes gene_type:complete
MKKSDWFIKEPTVRKVRNKGWRPVTYHGDQGFTSGWIYKVGVKWLHFYSPSYGKKRILHSDTNLKTIE